MTTAPHRTTSRGGGRAKPAHCPSGHAYTVENSGYRANGVRYCRICNRERLAQKRREAGAHQHLHWDHDPWIAFAAAIVRQSLDDYRSTGDDDARDFLVYCGIVDRNGYVRRH
jgi:hypothetical protein